MRRISIAFAADAFDGEKLTDGKLEGRLRSLARELVRFSRLHSLEPDFERRLLTVIDES